MGWWCPDCNCYHETSACPRPVSFSVGDPNPQVVTTSDPGTYVVVSKNWCQVRLDCIKELGYALMYMDYIWPMDDKWEPQRSRVLELCEEMAGSHNTRDTMEYWEDFHHRIIDEIENMC